MTMPRRLVARLITMLCLAVTLCAAVIPVAADTADTSPAAKTTTRTPIKHYITLMQENHSFDNYFGTYPGADGLPPGTCVPLRPEEPTAGCAKPFHIGGRPVIDLGHSAAVHEEQYRDGQLDGFISAYAQQPGIKDLAMGYYDDRDIPYYWNIADNYVLFDRAFTSAAGGSVWNHFFWVTGSPGNTKSDALLTTGFDHVPTIFDRLDAAGITWKFYIQNYDPSVTFRTPGNGDRASQIIWAPVLNYDRFLDNPRLRKNIVPLEQYFTDLRNNELPAVSYMVPSGASEHPPGSVQAGTRFVRSLVNALMTSTAWENSALMWTYDDWGGWYDHVPPPRVDKYGYGFRAPALLVSPYAKKGHIDHTTIDFTSQLKFIENNWGLKPLAERDRKANDIVSAFDFESAPRAPEILAEERNVQVEPPPKVSRVYALYGAALLFPAGLLAVYGRLGGLRRRTAALLSRQGRL
jgi:phospholipase C